ncbi:MAG: flavin reductase [Planctomycetes bacterium]|nr:flavin reductase [Planctomycetota bacterium]
MSETDRVKPWAAALGRIPSGMFIITVRHGDDETGMLASWVQQCSFDPPQVSIAVRHGRWLAGWLTEGAALVVNILDDTQTDMIVHFGRGFAPGEAAFNELEVERSESNTAVLSDALAFLECRVQSSVSAGDHDLCIARVVGGRVLNEGHSMVHIRKSGLHY